MLYSTIFLQGPRDNTRSIVTPDMTAIIPHQVAKTGISYPTAQSCRTETDNTRGDVYPIFSACEIR